MTEDNLEVVSQLILFSNANILVGWVGHCQTVNDLSLDMNCLKFILTFETGKIMAITHTALVWWK